jgi:hypothetical protein
MVVSLRNQLSEKIIGQPFLKSSSYLTPFVTHEVLPAVERTPQYIFVGLHCEAGWFSPYICAASYDHPDPQAVYDFLHRRADLMAFLARLLGNFLVCDCKLDEKDCWASLLQSTFCDIFHTQCETDDIGVFINDVLNSTSNNSDLLAVGLQPTRRRPDQLIPNGLKPHEHLQQALQEHHPYLSSSSSTNAVTYGLAWSPDDPHVLIQRRKEVIDLVEEPGLATLSKNALIMKIIDPNVVKVLLAYGSKNVILMRELAFLCQSSDNDSAMWMSLGIPMHGWAPPALGLITGISPPLMFLDEWRSEGTARNYMILLTIKSSGGETLDQSAFVKALKERDAGVIDGPYYDLALLNFQSPRLAPRHSI